MALVHKGENQHVPVMTATPIPRTLALTLYGDLDVTQLDELPPGRTPPVTRVLSGSAGEAKAIATMQRALALGRQAYWVCPLIEESDKLELANATARHATLVEALPSYRVGLVHGRLSTDEREEVMEAFRQGQVHALVATTVIEVGVDVPNASLMVVESAERFGLAQLHQLRGRIGRGSGASACLLLHGSGNEGAGTGSDFLSDGEEGEPRAPAKRGRKKAAATEEAAPSPSGSGTTSAARLAVLAQSSNGFHIAEADLRIRGPGEVLGTRQAGLPPLRYADLLRDIDLLQMVAEFLTPLDLSEDALAVEAIRDVGPGGHFFGTAHTQARYRNAFYSPVLSDWRNYETWQLAGSPTAIEKANRVWKERLASYEAPYMDPAIREELDAFVEKRIAEGGAPTDF